MNDSLTENDLLRLRGWYAVLAEQKPDYLTEGDMRLVLRLENMLSAAPPFSHAEHAAFRDAAANAVIAGGGLHLAMKMIPADDVEAARVASQVARFAYVVADAMWDAA